MNNKTTRTWASSNALTWLEIVLRERFGVKLKLAYITHVRKTYVTLENHTNKIIIDTDQEQFTRNSSDLAICEWDAQNETWHSILNKRLPAPSMSVLEKPLIEKKEDGYYIHYDILGLTYWMLSRQEEIGRTDLDNHGRFPATASHAYKHGYLERPIVDEWLHILGQVIQRTWPQLKLKQHQFTIKLSHDVDRPSRYAFTNVKSLTKVMVGDIFKYHDLKNFLLAPWIRLNSKHKLHKYDPYNTFDWLMSIAEEHNLKTAFYFICGGNNIHDADYKIDHPSIRELMRRIHARGHEIGLHPSYKTYQDPSSLLLEANRLKKICEEENVKQNIWGSRMHYLRWEHPTTLSLLENANMTYDSTLGYADHVGFRCGTCFEYPAFNPITNKSMEIRIRPLIIMDRTILNKNNYTNIHDIFEKIHSNCLKSQGCLTILWHNSLGKELALLDKILK